MEQVYSWESQARQYAPSGEPGISYERHYADGFDRGPENPVDCLLFRNDNGVLVGILNYYPQGDTTGLIEQAGNFNVWVAPDAQRHGVATALLRNARLRWTINLAQQRWSPQGLAWIKALHRRCSETEQP